jgi:hypothetical protein
MKKSRLKVAVLFVLKYPPSPDSRYENVEEFSAANFSVGVENAASIARIEVANEDQSIKHLLNN